MILPKTINVLIAGDGHDGCLMPALAVADYLQRLLRGVRVIFAGPSSAEEYRRITRAGFEYVPIEGRVGDSGQRGLWQRIRTATTSRQLLRRVSPAAVLCLGGPVALSVGRAASATSSPLILLETNARLGPEASALQGSADLICLAFDDTRKQIQAECPVRVTGLPVATPTSTPETDPSETDRGDPENSLKRLVILADSQRSSTSNLAAPNALVRLRKQLQGWRVVHQTSTESVRKIDHFYRRSGVDAVATRQIHRLPQQLARADLVLSAACRYRLSELAAAGAPTVLLPDAASLDRQLRDNTQLLQRNGACMLLDDSTHSSELAALLAPLLADRQRRRQMATRLQSHFPSDATRQIAEIVRSFICSGVAHQTN